MALNAARAEEERKGLVRWLRPELQAPAGARAATQIALVEAGEAAEAAPSAVAVSPWPRKLPEQVSAVRDLVSRGPGGWSLAETCARFKGARKAEVESVLDALAALGTLVSYDRESGRAWQAALR